ncbi:hypothetical protein AYO38_09145 [bacterium SCGC AG-212-C10]|nr:hypothetical protein AYO38_09145 [bacterium SCGC AG-212-C10]
MKRGGPFSIFRGLAIGLTLSFVNLCGAFLTVSAIGGLGEWTKPQFVGMFGLIEVATGAAFVICPNIWRLPVAEAKLGTRGQDVKFAASTILIPHWVGGVKSIAGIACVAFAAFSEGVSFATPALALLVVYVAAASVGLSMLFARAGVMRPDLDVVGIVLKRPGHSDHALPEISLGSSIVQLLLNVCSFPSVKLFSPGVLYRPEFGPSSGALAWGAILSAVILAAGFLAWWGRLGLRAPRAQQRDAEQFAEGG